MMVYYTVFCSSLSPSSSSAGRSSLLVLHVERQVISTHLILLNFPIYKKGGQDDVTYRASENMKQLFFSNSVTIIRPCTGTNCTIRLVTKLFAQSTQFAQPFVTALNHARLHARKYLGHVHMCMLL